MFPQAKEAALLLLGVFIVADALLEEPPSEMLANDGEGYCGLIVASAYSVTPQPLRLRVPPVVFVTHAWVVAMNEFGGEKLKRAVTVQIEVESPV